MHQLQFTTADPLDHVCRTLDAMRKMGFGLSGLRVVQGADDAFRISVEFDANGSATVSSLVERLSACVGVEHVAHHGAHTGD